MACRLLNKGIDKSDQEEFYASRHQSNQRTCVLIKGTQAALILEFSNREVVRIQGREINKVEKGSWCTPSISHTIVRHLQMSSVSFSGIVDTRDWVS